MKKETFFLNRDAILSAVDIHPQPLEMPEWGGTVFIRPLTAEERVLFTGDLEALEQSDDKLKQLKQVTLFVVRVLCDADGKRLFADGDADQFNNKSFDSLQKIMAAGMTFNGIAPGALEDTKKN